VISRSCLPSRFHLKVAVGLTAMLLMSFLPSKSLAQGMLPIQWVNSQTTAPNCVAYSPDGTLLAVGDSGGVQIYTLSTGAVRYLPTTASANDGGSNQGGSEDYGGVLSVAFSPDGKTLADGGTGSGNNGVLEMWNVSTGKLISILNTTANQGVQSVAFSPDGKTLADGGINAGTNGNNSIGVVELWNVSSGTFIKSLKTAASQVNSVAFSPDSTKLADGGQNFGSGNNSGVLELWTISTGSLIASPGVATGGVLTVAISPDGKTLADGGYPSNGVLLQLWSVANGAPINSFGDSGNTTVNTLAYSPDSTTIAVGGYASNSNAVSTGGILQLWTVSNGNWVSLNTTNSDGVNSVAFAPSGKTLADVGTSLDSSSQSISSGAIELWTVASGSILKSISTPANFGRASVAYSSDGKTLVAGGFANTNGVNSGVLQLWNASAGTLTSTLKTSITSVYAVALSADGKTLAAVGPGPGFGGLVELWDLSNGTLITTLDTAASSAGQIPVDNASVAFSPNGKTLAVGGLNTSAVGVLELWDVTSATLISSLKTGAVTGVHSVAFSPDGKTLADGGQTSTNGVLETWDVSTQTLQNTLSTAASYAVASVAFSVDGKTLADGGLSGDPSNGAGIPILELWNTSNTTLKISLNCGSNFAIT